MSECLNITCKEKHNSINFKCSHSHCICTSNICEESKLCIRHCNFENHNHCVKQQCNEILNICKNNLCSLHCTEKNHLHCIVNSCPKTDICEQNNLCLIHCDIKNYF